MSLSYLQWSELLRDERLPAALIDLDAFDRNVDLVSRTIAPYRKKLRLATKSIRVPELIKRALARGKSFEGLMCYSAEEAHFLAQRGLDDFLVAYPSCQKSDLLTLRELHESGKKTCLVVDHPDNLAPLASAMVGAREPFKVIIEVDGSLRLPGGLLHIGVRRSPVRTVEQLGTLVSQIARFPQLAFHGVMVYEAQVAGLPDQNPFKILLNPVARLIRKISARYLVKKRAEIAEFFMRPESQGRPPRIFNGGGTGSLTFARTEPHLTELTAGSGLFCPHLFDYYSNIQFEPAAFFALQAVRCSDPDYVTCQGGGYIASGEPGWDRVPVPYLPAGLRLVRTEGCGEVQTPLHLPSGTRIKPGSPVLFRHAKAGELMERFNEVLLASEGRLVGKAKTYRGFGKSFF